MLLSTTGFRLCHYYCRCRWAHLNTVNMCLCIIIMWCDWEEKNENNFLSHLYFRWFWTWQLTTTRVRVHVSWWHTKAKTTIKNSNIISSVFRYDFTSHVNIPPITQLSIHCLWAKGFPLPNSWKLFRISDGKSEDWSVRYVRWWLTWSDIVLRTNSNLQEMLSRRYFLRLNVRVQNSRWNYIHPNIVGRALRHVRRNRFHYRDEFMKHFIDKRTTTV